MTRSYSSRSSGNGRSSNTNTAPPPYTPEDQYRRQYQSGQNAGYHGPSESTATDRSALPDESNQLHAQNTTHYDERTPLNPGPARPKRKVQRWRPTNGTTVMALITVPIILLLVSAIICISLSPRCDLDPVEMEKLRHQWSLELTKHMQERKVWEAEQSTWEDSRLEHKEELRREKEELERQRNQRDQERKVWERERLEHEREKQRELEEKRRREEQQRRERDERIRLGLYWDEVQGSDHCYASGTREYTARLMNLPATYDGMKGCQSTPITIHGVTVDHPYKCENRGFFEGMYGHFLVKSGETACSPYWGTFEDKGCTAEGSHIRQIESRLWNILQGENWNQMCTTTPADFRNLHFEGPRYCEDKGIWGIYGIWEVGDSGC